MSRRQLKWMARGLIVSLVTMVVLLMVVAVRNVRRAAARSGNQ